MRLPLRRFFWPRVEHRRWRVLKLWATGRLRSMLQNEIEPTNGGNIGTSRPIDGQAVTELYTGAGYSRQTVIKWMSLGLLYPTQQPDLYVCNAATVLDRSQGSGGPFDFWPVFGEPLGKVKHRVSAAQPSDVRAWNDAWRPIIGRCPSSAVDGYRRWILNLRGFFLV